MKSSIILIKMHKKDEMYSMMNSQFNNYQYSATGMLPPQQFYQQYNTYQNAISPSKQHQMMMKHTVQLSPDSQFYMTTGVQHHRQTIMENNSGKVKKTKATNGGGSKLSQITLLNQQQQAQLRNFPERALGSGGGPSYGTIPGMKSPQNHFATVDDVATLNVQLYNQQQSLLKQKKATIKKKQLMFSGIEVGAIPQQDYSNLVSGMLSAKNNRPSDPNEFRTLNHQPNSNLQLIRVPMPLGSVETEELMSMREDAYTNRRESNLPGIPKSKVVGGVELPSKKARGDGARYTQFTKRTEDSEQTAQIIGVGGNSRNLKQNVIVKKNFVNRTQSDDGAGGHSQYVYSIHGAGSSGCSPTDANGNPTHSRFSSQSKLNNFNDIHKLREHTLSTIHQNLDQRQHSMAHKNNQALQKMDSLLLHEQLSQKYLATMGPSDDLISRREEYVLDNNNQDTIYTKRQSNKLAARPQVPPSILMQQQMENRRISNHQYQTMPGGQEEPDGKKRRSSIINKAGFRNNLVELQSVREEYQHYKQSPNQNGETNTTKSPLKKRAFFLAPSERQLSLEPSSTNFPENNSAEGASVVKYKTIENSGSLESKREAARPQATIKIRKRNEQVNKIATLRQLSNEPQLGHVGGRSSLGTEVAVIDNLDEDDEDALMETAAMGANGSDANSGSAFQRVMQMKNINQGLTKRRTEGSKALSRNAPLVKVTSAIVQQQTMDPPHLIGGEASLMRESLMSGGGASSQIPSKNRLPPSMKNCTISERGGDFSSSVGNQSLMNQQQVTQSQQNLQLRSSSHNGSSNNGSQTRDGEGKIKINKKKIKMLHKEQVSLNPSENRIHHHRSSKVLSVVQSGSSLGTGRAQSTPNDHNNSTDVKSSNCASKIDKILAKIDKARADSQLKNNINMIFKKNHEALVQAVGTQLDAQPLNKVQSQVFTFNNKQVDPSAFDSSSPSITHQQNQVLAQQQQQQPLKGRYESEGSRQHTASLEELKQGPSVQQKKVFKILKVNKTDTMSGVKRDESESMSSSNLMIQGKIKKKLKIKGSQERNLEANGFSSTATLTLGSTVKQVSIRDSQSIEKPSNQSDDREFSPQPSGASQMMQQRNIDGGKKLKLKVKQTQKKQEDVNEPMVKLMDSIEEQQQDSAEKQQQVLALPTKRSFLHSMQPNLDNGKKQLPLQIQTFSAEYLLVVNDQSAQQSTEVSNNPFITTQTTMANNCQPNMAGGINFDQSSICITSGGSVQPSLQKVPQRSQFGPQNHMKIQDAANLFSTTSKENPLEISLKSSLYMKISSRYAPPDQQIPIKEESNEEKDSSSNSTSQRFTIGGSTIHQQQQRAKNLKKKKRVEDMEENELHIEPIDKDDLLFKEINIMKSSKQDFLPLQQTERYNAEPQFQQRRKELQNSNGLLSKIPPHGAPGITTDRRYSRMHNNNHDFFGGAMNDDEGISEDNEAVEIVGGGNAKAEKITSTALNLDLTPLMRKSIDKKKHWLLDSGRFNDIIQQANQCQTGGAVVTRREDLLSQSSSSPSDGINSDTVVFEKENSSLAGTPPKIAKKNKEAKNRQQVSRRSNNSSDNNVNSSRIIPKHPPPPKASQANQDEQKQMPVEYAQKFDFSEEAIEEMKEAQHIAMLDKMLEPLLDKSLVSQKAVPIKSRDVFMKTLNTRLNIKPEEMIQPTNPYWVLSKRFKVPNPLDHYMKPTYYDVIYLQPRAFDEVSSQKKEAIKGQRQAVGPLENGQPTLEMHFNFD